MPLQWHGDFRRNSVYKERQFQVVWAYVTAPFQWIWPESRRSAIRVDAAAVTGRPLPSATSDRLQVGVAVTGFATLQAVAGGLDPYCGATRLWPNPLKSGRYTRQHYCKLSLFVHGVSSPAQRGGLCSRINVISIMENPM